MDATRRARISLPCGHSRKVRSVARDMISPGFVKCAVATCSRKFTARIEITFKERSEPGEINLEPSKEELAEIT